MPLQNSSQVFKMRAKLRAFALKTNTKTKGNFIYNTAISLFK